MRRGIEVTIWTSAQLANTTSIRPHFDVEIRRLFDVDTTFRCPLGTPQVPFGKQILIIRN